MPEITKRIRKVIAESPLSESEVVSAITSAESRRKRNGSAPKGTYNRRDMRAED